MHSAWLRYTFVIIGISIAASFLIVSNNIASDLAKEERQKIELWADAVKLAGSENMDGDLELALKILSGNESIPVVLCDEQGNIQMSVNIDVPKADSVLFYKKTIANFSKTNKPIIIQDEEFSQIVYYGDSTTLKRLQYYPYIQIGVLTLFICISMMALLSTKKSEQNKLWVGLSKETAHQLGTPISSIMAWVEYLKTQDVDPMVIDDLNKDAERLKVVTDRFSKIGSKLVTEQKEIRAEVVASIDYLRKRISKQVDISFDTSDDLYFAEISPSLFSWVIENITKNAVDAMVGKGKISIKIWGNLDTVLVDISDTGKGIAKSKFKRIFKPGYTTKERGWGLGLSLVKRIMEELHNGKVYVLSSEIDKGTVFRIELKRIYI